MNFNTNMKCSRDKYIQMVLEDPNISIKMDGTIWTRKSRNGASLIPNNGIRRIDKLEKKDRYMMIRYTFESGSRDDPKMVNIAVHRLIYAKFVGSLDENLVINHIDGNKTNNKPSNLELVTPQHNHHHALTVLGQDPIRNAKINSDIAEKIRDMRKNGSSYKEISNKYGLCKGSISMIINDLIWNKNKKF